MLTFWRLQPVMNPTVFYSTLGNLVNDVLQRVLDEIMEQIDISEEESIRLNKLCKMLHGLEELFEGDVVRRWYSAKVYALADEWRFSRLRSASRCPCGSSSSSCRSCSRRQWCAVILRRHAPVQN